MQKRTQQIMVGLFMIIGSLAMVYLALKVSGLTNFKSSKNYYSVVADFDNIGGLKVRAPVSVAGVRIGEVGAIRLDPVTFRANVTLYINSDENTIPMDSAASIYTQGLLGANYVSLTPGYSDTYLKNGDKIASTSPALVLEKLIGQLIFSLKDSGSKKE